ncbi:MAG: PhoH family protein [bacterium]|nr:PhoH family protein [bacterium]
MNNVNQRPRRTQFTQSGNATKTKQAKPGPESRTNESRPQSSLEKNNSKGHLSLKPGHSLSFKEVESRRGKNIIIVDTNVLIESVDRAIPDLLKGGNLLVIPYQVLMELDGLKKRFDVAEEAQRAIKAIQALQTANKGNLIIEKEQRKMKFLDMTKPDHRILATVNFVLQSRKSPNSPYIGYSKVKLITNDDCEIIFAKVVGLDPSLIVEKYKKDQVKIPKTRLNLRTFKMKSGEIKMDGDGRQYYDIKSKDKLPKNDAVLILTETDSYQEPQFVAVREEGKLVFLKNTFSVSGIKPLSKKGMTNWQQIIAMHYLLDPSIHCVILQGGAGTGKTLLALAGALECVAQGMYDQIILTRSVVGPPDEDMGFAPGDVNNKASHWLLPIFQNLSLITTRSSSVKEKKQQKNREKLIDANRIVATGNEGMKMLEEKKISFQPLQHIRGASYQRAVIIIEEGSNLSRDKIKTIVTRVGVGTKLIITGDLSQIDNPRITRESSGLAHIIAKMRNHPLVRVVMFDQHVRSPLAELAANVL